MRSKKEVNVNVNVKVMMKNVKILLNIISKTYMNGLDQIIIKNFSKNV